jgi:transcriptional regulator with XRE-family HTH domain
MAVLLSLNDNIQENSRADWGREGMNNMANQAFGKLLRRFRLRAGIGLRRFAEMIEVEPSNLSALEHGRRSPPAEPERLRAIADAVGLVEGSADWEAFFNAARKPGELPADVRQLADRKLVPTLLRTIDNQQLTDQQIARLIDESHGGSGHGSR